MNAADRIARRLLDSDVPLERAALLRAAPAVAAEEAPLAEGADIVAAVDSLVGLGPLEDLLRDPAVSDVLVNGPDEVWVERAGTLQRTPVQFPSAEAIDGAVQRAIAPLGLRLDRASPAVDARLPDGSRLHALVSPAAVAGPVVAVRRFTEAVPDLAALEACGGIDSAGAELLQGAVHARRNLVVAGGTGSGKTTLLNILSKHIPAGERVVSIEDAAELRMSGHVVRLEARPPNAEGAGEITLRALLRHALRLRPDRLVIGEVRGSEAFDMIQALSTGHAGSMSTVHADTATQALLRIATLAMSGGEADPEAITSQLRTALDLVVVMGRRGGVRAVRSITALDDGAAAEVWSW